MERNEAEKIIKKIDKNKERVVKKIINESKYRSKLKDNLIIDYRADDDNSVFDKREINETYSLIAGYVNKLDLAKQFLEIISLYYDKAGLWWKWKQNQFKYELIDEVGILNLVGLCVKNVNITQSSERTEILNAIRQEARKKKPKQTEKEWLQFDSEVINFKTGERFEATPEYFFTNPIPYSLGRTEETPTMDKIFKEWVGEKFVRTLYEIIAYCILADYPIHRLFILIGAGLNGKTCFLNLLRKFIGKDNLTTTELDTLLTSRFEITRLHKKLVCIMGETNFNQLSQTSRLKKLTGADLIGFEYKHKNPFEDFNYAKLIIATNTLPVTTDKTIGFYRRQLIVDFNNVFSEKKDILLEIPEQEYHNLATKSIRILMELLDKREFTNEGSIQDRKERYEEKSNPLDKFIKDNCEIDENFHIFKYEFRDVFSSFLNKNNYRKWTDKEIGVAMKEKFDDKQIYTDVFNKETREWERKTYWAYLGIKLKKPASKLDKRDKREDVT